MVMKLRKFECSATYLYLKNTVSTLSVLLLLIVSFFVGSNFVLSRSAGCEIDRPVAEEAEVCGLDIIKLIFR